MYYPPESRPEMFQPEFETMLTDIFKGELKALERLYLVLNEAT